MLPDRQPLYYLIILCLLPDSFTHQRKGRLLPVIGLSYLKYNQLQTQSVRYINQLQYIRYINRPFRKDV